MSKIKGPSQSVNQKVVRVGEFKQFMKDFREEQAKRFPHLMFDYHNKFFAPEIRRIRLLERGGLIRMGGFLILALVDWRIAAGMLFVFWYPIVAETRRALGSLFIKAWILVTWEVSYEKIADGWTPKWYQGLARQKDDATGFVFHLKPLHWLIRGYDAWHRIRAARRKREEEPTDGDS